MKAARNFFWIFFPILLGGILFHSPVYAQTSKPQNIFLRPGEYSARDLYKMAHEAFSAGDIDGARLLALRVFFDGQRSQNLLDLLGAIEIKANRHLFAGEWLRKALCINPDDSVAKKILARLPPPPRAIPIEAEKLADHFSGIMRKLPPLLARLTSPKLHFDAVLDELERGQFYKALALSEEFEKRYPGVDGPGLTALCAFYLGRTTDCLQIVEANLPKSPFNPLLLFVKAMVTDSHPETSSSSKAKALFDLDRWDEALKVADQITQGNPRSSEGLLVKARIMLEQLKVQEANRFLAEAAQKDPDNPAIGVLKADLEILAERPQAASEELQRAYKRGYNLPSVNLKAGLLAAQNGKMEDAKAILNEYRNCFPLVDRDAYQYFTRLAIEIGELTLAQKCFDEWKARFPENSLACYCEAFYYIKSGDGIKALEKIRRGFQLNPNRLMILREIADTPILDVDPELAMNVANRIKRSLPQTPKSELSQPAKTQLKVKAPLKQQTAALPSVQPTGEIPATQIPQSSFTNQPGSTSQMPSDNQAPAVMSVASSSSGPRFKIESPSDVSPETTKSLEEALNNSMDKVESLLGFRGKTVFVQLSSKPVAGSRVAHFDWNNNKLLLSTVYFDQNQLTSLIAQERPDIDPEKLFRFIQNYPHQILTEELSEAVLAQRIKNLKTALPNVAWMVKGLGQIIGGDNDVLHDRLLFTQNLIASGQATLLSPETVNKLFSATSCLPAEILNAYTHSYLIAAFLLKKKENFTDAVKSFLKLIDEVCQGKPFEKALLSTFGLSKEAFESGWKDSAFWCLQQGIPFEW